MERRQFIKHAGIAGILAAGVAPAAHAQGGNIRWRLASSFPKALDTIFGAAETFAKKVGESRNALVRQAVSEWLKRRGKPQWPEEVLAFKGMADMPLFEASRDRLRPPVEDPLA
mgnify:CR=1 FL=1